jgi:hypothetical protein
MHGFFHPVKKPWAGWDLSLQESRYYTTDPLNVPMPTTKLSGAAGKNIKVKKKGSI